MALETIAATAAIGLLRKPIDEIISFGGKNLREYFQQWQATSSLNSLAEKIEQVGLITTIASRQSSTVSTIYYPAQLKVGKGTRVVSSVDELISGQNRLILINGTAGQGKSVFLRYLCLQDLKIAKIIPLFIELRKIDHGNDLNSLIRSYLLSLGFKENLIESAMQVMLHSGKIRLFLDGFDEVKREYALGVKEQIQILINKNSKLTIILSSRPGALSQYLFDIGNLHQYEIAPLAEKDYAGFFEKIGVQIDTKERLLAAIDRSNAQIKKLLSTPLMLTLLVITCGMQQDLPDTLPEFYDSLFNLLASMHDGTKPGYVRQKATNLSNQELETLFRAFSFAAKELVGRISLNASQFEKSVIHASKITEIKCTVEGFRTDVTESVCLMAKEGLDTTFVHKSIQEYYAASFIHHIEDDELACKVLQSIQDNHLYSWLNELRFLEDFQNLSYEKHIGIPHAQVFINILCFKNRKLPILSKAKFKSLIASLGIHVARTKLTKQYTSIYWRPDSIKVAPNRYFSDLIQAISKELESLGKKPSSPALLADSMVFLSISKLVNEDPVVLDALMAAGQRVCETVHSSSSRMTLRRARKGKSLLDLMSAKPMT